jgi:tol-pal system protein YbgF
MNFSLPTDIKAGGSSRSRRVSPSRPAWVGALVAGSMCLSATSALAGGGFNLPLPGRDAPHKMIVLAQNADEAARAMQLEEEVRSLNGKVEDLNFQLLQLQETLRKMQEDNEFRFQELEGGKQGAVQLKKSDAPEDGTLEAEAPAGEPAPGKLQPSEQDAGAQSSDGVENPDIAGVENAPGKPPRMVDGVEVYEEPATGAGVNPVPGLEPRNLGTLRFDENGNVIEAAPGDPVDLSNPAGDVPVQSAELPPPGGGQDGGETLPGVEVAPKSGAASASLEYPQDPDQLYDLGYGYVKAGDYKQAESAFREFTERYKSNPRLGEARFWLGESVFEQRRYEDAAKIFLDTHKKFPQSPLGAQNLLKLGVSLAGMNQRELACATLAEVPNKYPDLSNAVRAKVAAEQKAASCTTN